MVWNSLIGQVPSHTCSFGCVTCTASVPSPVFIHHNTTHHKYGYYVLVKASRVSNSPGQS